MSNTSYSFKENSHVIVNQGGEKKVMKKILSVALSTAMAFSMFASVAFGADAKLTDEQQFNALKEAGILTGYPDGQSHLEKALTRAELAKIIVKSIGLEPVTGVATYKDKNYTANHWAAPFIEAATQAGILNGKDATKKLFDPTGNVTVQELAKVLVTALKLEVPTDANNTASEWAKGYVAAAVKAGYLQDGINYQANASRSQAVVAAYAIYEAAQIPTVTKYEVKDSKNVEFTLSNGDVVKVALETALEGNKATDVKFTHNGHEYTHSVTWVLTSATKVEKVNADNLKEVVVTFDGEVDKATAELKENYSLSTGSVDSASLSEDKKVVTLTLVGNGIKNQVANKLSVSGVKAGDKVITAKDIAFTPVDSALPAVVKVDSLGTKAVKITFSEPIKQSPITGFKLDGKAFYGQPTINSRVVTLVAYDTSALTVGEHTLTITNVEDYSGLKNIPVDQKFTVVEDKTAPTIESVEATLEKAVVTFSEDVDPDTVKKENVYWKSGDTKYKASSLKSLAGNKYEFNFDADVKLPTYEVSFFVEGVKDYSGNEIKETSKLVKAAVDTERPNVIDVKVNSTNDGFTIRFNKKLKAVNTDNVKVLDKDGKLRSIKTIGLNADKNAVVVTMYEKLPEGLNTIKVTGIKDNTALENMMLDYTYEVNVGDKTSPKYDSHAVNFDINNGFRRVIVVFNEKMDPATLGNAANYTVTFNGVERALPAGTDLTVTQDSKAVVIDFPEEIDGVKVLNNSISQLKVFSVKDAAGNVLDGFTRTLPINNNVTAAMADINSDHPGNEAQLLDNKTIEVKFDQPITRATASDFVVSVGGSAVDIDSVSANNTGVVKITLKNELNTTATGTIVVRVPAANAIETAVGKVKINADATTAILDKAAPVVVAPKNGSNVEFYNVQASATGATYDVIVPFSEALDSGSASYYANDLIVTREFDNKVLTAGTDYSTSVATGSNLLRVTIAANGFDSKYKVEVKAATYIQDLSAVKNKAAAKGAISTTAAIDYKAVGAPTLSGTYKSADYTKISAGETVVLTFDDAINAANIAALTSELQSKLPGLTLTSSNSTTFTFTNNGADVTISTLGVNGKITLTAANLTDDEGNTPTANVDVQL
ncbi:Ig-like domain-containing protein [Paenibacillus sp. Marseille-P2973]|uniref:Ig-like domain-containing protein n=1 Tax=Paenibacillus sp. Marseille-P2973 TaxID=1871032 RepID=UPI001B392435|nr:Ig-like domain-containing protein [Paenibacillus sp. Marseille-P2973]MBQ4900039.1 Ig-like domain-containing protein [Paenibacillus sp. Marseille-P2973]